MPIYEYLCQDCHKRNAILTLNPHRLDPVLCRHCGGSKMNRLLSRFSAPKSEEARLESLADPATLDGLDESDPRSVARLMKKMGQELGEDVSDVDAMLDEPRGDDSEIGHTDDL
ncbi:MAG TPA: zinc ribbon domain-containing protein [Nitrospira sp.]|nr:zinc ribbon domain-containing protein [Nitrospira sp.]